MTRSIVPKVCYSKTMWTHLVEIWNLKSTNRLSPNKLNLLKSVIEVQQLSQIYNIKALNQSGDVEVCKMRSLLIDGLSIINQYAWATRHYARVLKLIRARWDQLHYGSLIEIGSHACMCGNYKRTFHLGHTRNDLKH